MRISEEYQENNEIDQDRVEDTISHFKRFGFVMFKQNRLTYENIAKRLNSGSSVLEAGCGMGLGSAVLERKCPDILATDKGVKNVRFARELYPWMTFDTWDIGKSAWKEKYDTVVCVEAIEHVKRYTQAVDNLLASSSGDVWISTPNRNGTGENRPSNPYHVKEFSPEEMLSFIGDREVEILSWDKFEKLDVNTRVNPLVYHIL